MLQGAHELLDEPVEETDRLLHEKEPAIHYLARALIEHGELIGDELEGGLQRDRDETLWYLRRPFERKVLVFRPFGRDMRPEEPRRSPSPKKRGRRRFARGGRSDGDRGRDVAAAATGGRSGSSGDPRRVRRALRHADRRARPGRAARGGRSYHGGDSRSSIAVRAGQISMTGLLGTV